jgi:hypothetical protein
MKLNTDPKRLLKEVNVFNHKQENPITWKDLKSFNLQDDWSIYMDEEYDDDKPYMIIAYVISEETDEEYAARLAEIKRLEENTFKLHQKNRYQHYVKLKEEFEGKDFPDYL